MKKNIFAVLAAVTLVIAMAGGAWAVDPTVTATGTVLATCTAAGNGTIAFDIDPNNAGPITASTADPGNTAPSVYCTNGTTFGTVTCTPDAGLDNGAGDVIPYAVSTCPASVVGSGYNTPAPFDIAIQVTQANYGNAVAGAHTGTITITVAP